MNSDKHKKRSPVDVTDKSQNKQKQITVNFIPVDKLGDASESTSTSSVSEMKTVFSQHSFTERECYKS